MNNVFSLYKSDCRKTNNKMKKGKGRFMKKALFIITPCIILLLMGGCSTVPKTDEQKDVLTAEVNSAVSLFQAKDPSINRFFESSYAYAVLPKVFKGGFWVGGAGGRGEVFEERKMTGYCRMSQATLGFTFGGEYFREIVFFRDKEDFDKFTAGEYTFAAQVTGVALSAGAAAKTDYKAGMAVFIMSDVGLMVDASLGGQKFNYSSKYLPPEQK
jgi:lipid-binding SYLF domain-containing protein